MRIIVADDHTLFREGLCFLLQELGDDAEIIETNDFAETVETVRQAPRADLVLLDLLMPDMDSFTGLRNLRAVAPSVPIVVISARDDRQTIRRVMQSGAAGFISKSASSQIMLKSIHQVLDGLKIFPEALDASLAGSVRFAATARERYDRREAQPALTRRQKDVLRLLGEGKSNKEIARELDLAEGTIKVHVTAILRALNVANRTQAVILANELDLDALV